MSDLPSHLAANLRHLRGVRSLTQQQLSRLSALPRSTLAQLETGAGNPTLAVLSRIAAALRISIEELLSAPRARCHLYRKGTLPAQARGKGGEAVVHKLLPDPIPGMEIDRIELAPRARMTGVPHRPGTREYLACERGRIALWTAGERLDLAPGDVAAFEGDRRHSYANEGDAVAIGFSVVTLAPI
jgi:DNA-binding XRE family transcriptional regulator/quercetin dioxygenase-like cupin family protein